jgi:hypothetical protein
MRVYPFSVEKHAETVQRFPEEWRYQVYSMARRHEAGWGRM